jgi:hypothetical protein
MSNFAPLLEKCIHMIERLPIIGFVATGVLMLFLFLLYLFLEGSARDFLIEEGGLVELASALGHFLCAALIVYKGRLAYLRQYYYVFLLIVFFMLRELDFHEKFTTMGIFKSKFFLINNVPWVEKFFGAIIILLLLFMIFKIIHGHLKEFLLGLKNKCTISIGVFIACVFIVLSKSLDGISRKFKVFGVEILDQTAMHSMALEEILELGLPLILLITLHAYFKRKNFHHKLGSERDA